MKYATKHLSREEPSLCLTWPSVAVPPSMSLYFHPKPSLEHLCRPCKTGSLQAFARSVSNISAGKDEKTPGQAVKGNRQGSYSNRQAGKCTGQAGFFLFSKLWGRVE